MRQVVPFAAAGGGGQLRYERLRAYVLDTPDPRPRVNPAQFDLRRLNRFGLLGLVDHVFRGKAVADFEVEVVPIGSVDGEDRLSRLLELLAGMLDRPEGGGDATGGALRPGLDGSAGTGADDPEPARRRHAVR